MERLRTLALAELMVQPRFHAALSDIPATAWDALRCDDNPFLAHAFLNGLEQHGCIREEYGWRPAHLGLYDDDRLVGAAPLYLKTNSHGEFVFDWSWANAYEKHGLDYYPKLLCAIPYSPVTGPRLLVGENDLATRYRLSLIEAIEQLATTNHFSSAHLNFAMSDDIDALRTQRWLSRQDWQFHWHNRGWRDFDDFLGALKPKKRKNIRQERVQVARAGIQCEIRHGDELSADDWHRLHQLYLSTFDAHGNHPALTEAFFAHLGETMPRQILAVMCFRGHDLIAAAICLRSNNTLHGRYWGAHEDVPGLHFEACYYQGIDYCLRHGLTNFEPGAQGEHKVARGFLPAQTRSMHYIVDARFRSAISDALRRETHALDAYRNDVLAHSPYLDQETSQ